MSIICTRVNTNNSRCHCFTSLVFSKEILPVQIQILKTFYFISTLYEVVDHVERKQRHICRGIVLKNKLLKSGTSSKSHNTKTTLNYFFDYKCIERNSAYIPSYFFLIFVCILFVFIIVIFRDSFTTHFLRCCNRNAGLRQAYAFRKVWKQALILIFLYFLILRQEREFNLSLIEIFENYCSYQLFARSPSFQQRVATKRRIVQWG